MIAGFIIILNKLHATQAEVGKKVLSPQPYEAKS